MSYASGSGAAPPHTRRSSHHITHKSPTFAAQASELMQQQQLQQQQQQQSLFESKFTLDEFTPPQQQHQQQQQIQQYSTRDAPNTATSPRALNTLSAAASQSMQQHSSTPTAQRSPTSPTAVNGKTLVSTSSNAGTNKVLIKINTNRRSQPPVSLVQRTSSAAAQDVQPTQLQMQQQQSSIQNHRLSNSMPELQQSQHQQQQYDQHHLPQIIDGRASPHIFALLQQNHVQKNRNHPDLIHSFSSRRADAAANHEFESIHSQIHSGARTPVDGMSSEQHQSMRQQQFQQQQQQHQQGAPSRLSVNVKLANGDVTNDTNSSLFINAQPHPQQPSSQQQQQDQSSQHQQQQPLQLKSPIQQRILAEATPTHASGSGTDGTKSMTRSASGRSSIKKSVTPLRPSTPQRNVVIPITSSTQQTPIAAAIMANSALHTPRTSLSQQLPQSQQQQQQQLEVQNQGLTGKRNSSSQSASALRQSLQQTIDEQSAAIALHQQQYALKQYDKDENDLFISNSELIADLQSSNEYPAINTLMRAPSSTALQVGPSNASTTTAQRLSMIQKRLSLQTTTKNNTPLRNDYKTDAEYTSQRLENELADLRHQTLLKQQQEALDSQTDEELEELQLALDAQQKQQQQQQQLNSSAPNSSAATTVSPEAISPKNATSTAATTIAAGVNETMHHRHRSSQNNINPSIQMKRTSISTSKTVVQPLLVANALPSNDQSKRMHSLLNSISTSPNGATAAAAAKQQQQHKQQFKKPSSIWHRICCCCCC
jgi:hypothetical protein